MGLLDNLSNLQGNNRFHQMDSGIRLLQAVLALLADNGQGGGLQGLTERFQEAGLSNAISSWIDSGTNVPVTDQQIRTALGDGQLQQISEESGLSEDETAHQLSELLPTLIDRLTPAGHIPKGGLGDMSTLLERFVRIER